VEQLRNVVPERAFPFNTLLPHRRPQHLLCTTGSWSGSLLFTVLTHHIFLLPACQPTIDFTSPRPEKWLRGMQSDPDSAPAFARDTNNTGWNVAHVNTKIKHEENSYDCNTMLTTCPCSVRIWLLQFFVHQLVCISIFLCNETFFQNSNCPHLRKMLYWRWTWITKMILISAEIAATAARCSNNTLFYKVCSSCIFVCKYSIMLSFPLISALSRFRKSTLAKLKFQRNVWKYTAIPSKRKNKNFRRKYHSTNPTHYKFEISDRLQASIDV